MAFNNIFLPWAICNKSFYILSDVENNQSKEESQQRVLSGESQPATNKRSPLTRMSFKLFRRGSARCIGLLSAFVTILLCLYYISIGQPNPTPISETGAPSAALRGSPLSGLTGFSVDGGSSSIIHQQKQQLVIASNQKKSSETKSAQTSVSPEEQSEEQYTNSNWGDKCYELIQSNTNITASEEHSKFDFQVRRSSTAILSNTLIIRISYSRNGCDRRSTGIVALRSDLMRRRRTSSARH